MVKMENIIGWEESRLLTADLIGSMTSFSQDIKDKVCNTDGIFALAYQGDELSFGLWQEETPKIIFLGEGGESAKRHFDEGRTGYSTLRRSLTALLWQKLDLHPIPRTNDEADVDRFSNYALDEESDKKLSQWMQGNLQICFIPLEKAKVLPSLLGLISYNVPLLNLQNNPENRYGAEIKNYRKKCEEAALQTV